MDRSLAARVSRAPRCGFVALALAAVARPALAEEPQRTRVEEVHALDRTIGDDDCIDLVLRGADVDSLPRIDAIGTNGRDSELTAIRWLDCVADEPPDEECATARVADASIPDRSDAGVERWLDAVDVADHERGNAFGSVIADVIAAETNCGVVAACAPTNWPVGRRLDRPLRHVVLSPGRRRRRDEARRAPALRTRRPASGRSSIESRREVMAGHAPAA